jgi:hypothetical protein
VVASDTSVSRKQGFCETVSPQAPGGLPCVRTLTVSPKVRSLPIIFASRCLLPRPVGKETCRATGTPWVEDPQVGCPLTVGHVDCERLMKINAAIARLITSILFQPAGHNMALCARAVRHFENFADCSGGHRPSYPEAGNTDERSRRGDIDSDLSPRDGQGRRPFKPSIGGSAKRHTTSWNSEKSAWTKDSQAIKAVFSRIA